MTESEKKAFEDGHKAGLLLAATIVEEKSRVKAWQPGLTDGRHYAKAIREVAERIEQQEVPLTFQRYLDAIKKEQGI